MANLTTKTEIPDEVGVAYLKDHLLMEVSELNFEQFAKNLPIERKKGAQSVRVRRYNVLNPATTPLTEGTTPAGSKPSVVNVEIPLKQYGDYIQYTDLVNMTSYDDTIADFSKLTGTQKGETKDTLCRNALLAGTNVVYAGGKTGRTNLTTADKLTQEMIDKIEATLKRGKAKKITEKIKTKEAVAMEPVDACFVAFISIDGKYQLDKLPKFIPVEKYAQNGKTFANEVGKVGSIRFIEADKLETINSTVKVEQLIAFGQEAYGRAAMDSDGNGELIIKDLGESGEDPINQRGSVGWKDYLGYKILNEKFIVRGEFAQ